MAETTDTAAAEAAVEKDAAKDIAKGLDQRAKVKPATTVPISKLPEDPSATATPTADADTIVAAGGEDGKAANEVKQLRDRLAKMEGQQDALQQKRLAGDAVDTFIREKCDGLPREMMRKLLPETTDTKVLEREAHKIEGYFKEYIDYFVKKGSLIYRTVGGSAGGMSPLQMRDEMLRLNAANASPSQLIAAGMASRQQNQSTKFG